jgi:hypothetical protein
MICAWIRTDTFQSVKEKMVFIEAQAASTDQQTALQREF